jgi:hypothetical protein
VFEPELPHNRLAFRRVARTRWYVVGALAPVAAAATFLAEPAQMSWLGPALLGALFAGLGVVEVKLFLIFRKDLYERTGREERT